MSLIVLAMIVVDLLRYDLHAPRHDEGTADHIAIVLMFGQLPIMLSLVISGWREWPRARSVLTLQIALWGLVFSWHRCEEIFSREACGSRVRQRGQQRVKVLRHDANQPSARTVDIGNQHERYRHHHRQHP